jgi:hypothetical protein
MELATLQSFVCVWRSRPIGLPAPHAILPFPVDCLVFRHSPSPESLRNRVHPLVSLPLLQSSPVRYPPVIRRCRASFLGASFPIATSAIGVHVRELPKARFVPSSAFLTPSTVCSSVGLAGLFHPAATSGINPSGVFPPSQPYHLVGGRCPRDV